MDDTNEQQQPGPTLIWAPGVIENVSELELELYIRFCNTACIPGGGCNVEEALDVLYKCQGDVKEAIKRLLTRETKEAVVWTLEEVHLFAHLFKIHRKDFTSISRDLKTKSVKDCVEFYYLWKKEQQQNHPPNTRYHYYVQQDKMRVPEIILKQENQEQPNQFHDATDQMMVFKQEHQQIGQQLPNVILHPQDPAQQLKPGQEHFACKVCGRIFLKIKSRSAHMKRHKNERLYNLT